MSPKNAEEAKALVGDKFTKRVIFTKGKMGAQTLEALVHASFEQPSVKEDELCHPRLAQRLSSASRPWSEPGQTAFEVDQSPESEAAFHKAVYAIKNGRSVTEYVEVIKKVARSETQQVQKQETKPELQIVDRRNARV